MVWVDIAIIALLTTYTIYGMVRGYRQEAYSLAVWIIGFVVAWFFSQEFAMLLPKTFRSPSARLAASFIALVGITLGVGGIIAWLLSGSSKKTRLTVFDRLGGLLVGWLHGMVVVLLMVVVAGLTALPKDRWWQQSKYLPPYQAVAILVKNTLSTKLANSINYR